MFVKSSSRPCRIHSSISRAISFVLLPNNMRNTMWICPSIILAVSMYCSRQTFYLLVYLASGSFIAPISTHKTESEKTWIPASWMFDNPSSKRPIVSETLCILMIWEEMSICKKSPSASWLTRIPARRSPLPWVQVNSQFLKCFKIKKNQNAKFLGLIRHVRLRLGLC